MKGRHLFWPLLALALLGCGPKRICTPPCRSDQKCEPAWTECSGVFALGGCQESQDSVCRPEAPETHCRETCRADQRCIVVGGSTIGQEWGCRCLEGFYQQVIDGPCLPVAPIVPAQPPPDITLVEPK